MTGISLAPVIPMWIVAIAIVIVMGCAVYETVKEKRAPKWRRIANMLTALVISFSLALIGARPHMEASEQDNAHGFAKQLDIVFVVDNTLSMWANDEEDKHTRLEAARADIKEILKSAPGATASIIIFDDAPRQLTPFSSDMISTTDAMTGIVQPDPIYAKGTDFSQVFKQIETVLKNREEEYPDRARLLFFLSDGEESSEDRTNLPGEALAGYIDGGYIIGYGKTSGSQIPINSLHSFENYVMSRSEDSYKPAITKLNEDSLKSISNVLKVGYGKHSSETLQSVRTITQDAWGKAPEDVEQDTDEITSDRELYYWFALPLAAAFAIWLILAASQRRELGESGKKTGGAHAEKA